MRAPMQVGSWCHYAGHTRLPRRGNAPLEDAQSACTRSACSIRFVGLHRDPFERPRPCTRQLAVACGRTLRTSAWPKRRLRERTNSAAGASCDPSSRGRAPVSTLHRRPQEATIRKLSCSCSVKRTAGRRTSPVMRRAVVGAGGRGGAGWRSWEGAAALLKQLWRRMVKLAQTTMVAAVAAAAVPPLLPQT
jgi:hypothetical protein